MFISFYNNLHQMDFGKKYSKIYFCNESMQSYLRKNGITETFFFHCTDLDKIEPSE